MPRLRWCLIGIVVILATVGLPLTKMESVPAQAEQQMVKEFNEIDVANRLANSNVRMNCKEFATLWVTLFPDAECYKYKTNLGTIHWVCEISDKLLVDANYRFDGIIRIRQK